MFVIDVIPFSRSAPNGTLSYRSRVALEPGSLVLVMLRRTQIRALVVHCESVRNMKSVIKRSSFTLSSSEPVRDGSLPKGLMVAAQEMSEYHAAPLGSVLQALIGEYVAAEQELVASTKQNSTCREAIEASPAGRATRYREIITDAAGRGIAVHLIAPTIAELLYWKETFKDLKPLVLSGATSPKDRPAVFARARESTGLVITTPGYVWLPMKHRAQFILDRISAGTYCMQKRPYLDLRRAADAYAKVERLSLCVGDFPLPLEYRTNPAAPLAAVQESAISILDMRTKKIPSVVAQGTESEYLPFKAVPDALLKDIRHEVANGGRVAVLAVRKGYAPTIVCHDCGQVVQDDRGLPLSFTIKGGIRSMRSIDGKTIRLADRLCVRCGSWNLVPLGIGIELVEEELRTEFPDTPIAVINVESMRTRATIRKVMERTSEAGTGTGSIVIGTEAALLWLMLVQEEYPVSLGIVASADSLLSLPFWRARERFTRLVLLFGFLSKKLIIATRQPEDSVFSITSKTTSSAFFSEETSLRKALHYPPFGTLIALQVEGLLKQRDAMQAQIESMLADQNITFLPDRPLTTTTSRRTGVIQLAGTKWPNKLLSAQLQSLGPSVRVILDPESLW